MMMREKGGCTGILFEEPKGLMRMFLSSLRERWVLLKIPRRDIDELGALMGALMR